MTDIMQNNVIVQMVGYNVEIHKLDLVSYQLLMVL